MQQHDRCQLTQLARIFRILTGRRGSPRQWVREAVRRGLKPAQSDLVGAVVFAGAESRREEAPEVRRGNRSRYTRHQGAREQARRRRQMRPWAAA